jgi:hypothetical protein
MRVLPEQDRGSAVPHLRLLGTLAALAAPGAVLLGQGMDPYRTTVPEHLAYHERDRALEVQPTTGCVT